MTTQVFASLSAQSRDYVRVAAALRRLAQGGSADLAAAAREAKLSPHHFQRMFRRWAGVSPRQFAAQLTLAELKRRMAGGESVLAASASAGLSGVARAHDVFVSHDAMTPGDFRRKGENITVRFGESETPFGSAFIAFSDLGVCALRFAPDDSESASSHSDSEGDAARDLMRDYPQAKLTRDNRAARKIAREIFENNASGARPPLFARGTNFQVNVWRALLAIPPGRVASYGALARALGRPGAARAVGRAAGANPIAFLIPCHRVIGECGSLRGYAWGENRKRLMLAREFSAAPPPL